MTKWKNISFFFVTLVLVVYVCCIGIKNIFRYNKFKLEAQENERVLKHLTFQQDAYNKKLLSIENEGTWELLAKTRLGYVKKGEVVYRFLPKQSLGNYE